MVIELKDYLIAKSELEKEYYVSHAVSPMKRGNPSGKR